MQIDLVPIKTWSFNRNAQKLLTWHCDGYTIKSQNTIYQVVYDIKISGLWIFLNTQITQGHMQCNTV